MGTQITKKSGKTTRKIDRLVQEYFENGSCFIYERTNDKFEEEKTNLLVLKFEMRLIAEHPAENFSKEFFNQDGISGIKISKK